MNMDTMRLAGVVYVGQEGPLRKCPPWTGEWNCLHGFYRALGADRYEGTLLDAESLAELSQYDAVIVNMNACQVVAELATRVPVFTRQESSAHEHLDNRPTVPHHGLRPWGQSWKAMWASRAVICTNQYFADALRVLGARSFLHREPAGTAADIAALPPPDCPDGGEIIAYRQIGFGAGPTCIVANALGGGTYFMRQEDADVVGGYMASLHLREISVTASVGTDEWIERLRRATLAVCLDAMWAIGRTPVDCAIAGVPIISSNRPESARALWPSLLVDPVAGIEDAIALGKRLLQSRQLRLDAAQGARERLATSFSAEIVNAETRRHIRAVLESKAS